MICPACGAANPEDKEFCGDCGVHLTTGEVPAAPEPGPDEAVQGVLEEPAPTSRVPESPYVQTTAIPHEQYSATPVAPPTSGYQQQPANEQPAYQQTPSSQPTYQQQAPSAQPTYSAPPATPPKKKTGMIIAIVAGVILLCILGCCVTLFFIPDDETTTDDENSIVVEQEGERGRIEISEEQGFESSMDALTDVADQYYRGEDWWYVEITMEDGYEEYYITPDEATYDKGVILESRNGEWFATDVYTVDMTQVAIEEGADEPATDTTALTAEEAAAWTVNEMLLAIMEGRIDDAYTFTTTPLYDYDLSELTGEYTDWEFLGAEIQEDGSAVVLFTMYWSDGTTENVGALLVVGDEGWYVSDIGSADE
ncbi:MAG: hypothetical protein Q7W51_01775 [Coriobacteriia bacterium]|nr:hypothetical protein [Coriobacteriia bacterium]